MKCPKCKQDRSAEVFDTETGYRCRLCAWCRGKPTSAAYAERLEMIRRVVERRRAFRPSPGSVEVRGEDRSSTGRSSPGR